MTVYKKMQGRVGIGSDPHEQRRGALTIRIHGDTLNTQWRSLERQPFRQTRNRNPRSPMPAAFLITSHGRNIDDHATLFRTQMRHDTPDHIQRPEHVDIVPIVFRTVDDHIDRPIMLQNFGDGGLQASLMAAIGLKDE